MQAEGHFWCHFCAHCWLRRSWGALLAPDVFGQLMACMLCTHPSLVANTDRWSALIKRSGGQSARAPFVFSTSVFPGSSCWFQAPHTMRRLHPPGRVIRCSIPPPRIKAERWLESFPDNRACFRGPALGGDPGAEQRALEKGLDLHKGAVTPPPRPPHTGCILTNHTGAWHLYTEDQLNKSPNTGRPCQNCIWHPLMVTCMSDVSK